MTTILNCTDQLPLWALELMVLLGMLAAFGAIHAAMSYWPDSFGYDDRRSGRDRRASDSINNKEIDHGTKF